MPFPASFYLFSLLFISALHSSCFISMAVQAKRSSFFNNQREMIMMNENMNLGSSDENLLPIYNNRSAICDSAMDRSATTDHDHVISRKRWRDHDSDHQFGYFIEKQHHQHQLELDHLISLHNEKIRLDIEERRKKYGRWMEGILMKTLKRKDEEIENIGKLNWALEERVKCLFMENQIWRELAETSQATANALRANLQQYLLLAHDQEHMNDHDDDEAESCCNADNMNMMMKNHRLCKCCGEMESCVLLLPCRHLSLCTLCGSSVHVCPVCNSPKTASVHVNFSNS